MPCICHRGTSRKTIQSWPRTSKPLIEANSKCLLMPEIREMMRLWQESWLHQEQLSHILRTIYIHQKIDAQCNSIPTKLWIWQTMCQGLPPLTLPLLLRLRMFSHLREGRLELKLSRRMRDNPSSNNQAWAQRETLSQTLLVTNKLSVSSEEDPNTTSSLKKIDSILSSSCSLTMPVEVWVAPLLRAATTSIEN